MWASEGTTELLVIRRLTGLWEPQMIAGTMGSAGTEGTAGNRGNCRDFGNSKLGKVGATDWIIVRYVRLFFNNELQSPIFVL